MKTTRRSFIKSTILGTAVGALAIEMLSHDNPALDITPEHGEGYQEPPKAESHAAYLEKIRNFDSDYQEDIHLSQEEFSVLKSTTRRLEAVQSYVGHANFNLISLDETLAYANKVSSIDSFKPVELKLIESLFFADATQMGFFGEKVIDNLTAKISRKEVTKIARSGHFVFRGDAQRLYEKIGKDLGESVVLTSGIRSVVKQVHLFMSKAVTTEGNLSRASRSLAPPGHSFHGIGDFDVGKRGFGYMNFTDQFAKTDEYKRLIDLGYVNIRYSNTNPYGVRFEPWHIKVV